MAFLLKQALFGASCAALALLMGCDGDVTWPIHGSLADARPQTATFGPHLRADGTFEFHRGIDVPLYSNIDTYAAANGRVYSIEGNAAPATGYQVTICHAFTADMALSAGCANASYYTFYAYLSYVNVRVGTEVSKGQTIGLTGTGPSGATHIHFELRRGGPEPKYAVHPLLYLPYANEVPAKVRIVDVDTEDPRHPVVTVEAENHPRERDLNTVMVRVLDNSTATGKEVSRRVLDFGEWNYVRTDHGGDDEVNTREIDGIRFEPDYYDLGDRSAEQRIIFDGLNGLENAGDMRFEATATDCRGISVQAFYP